MKKVFVDVNIIMDLLDNKREYDLEGNKIKNFQNLHQKAIELFDYFDENNIKYITSEDCITNVAYNFRKKKHILDDFVKILSNLDRYLNFQIVSFGQKVISNFADFYKRNDGDVDFEDGLQYFCALENECEAIYTNDKSSFPKLEISLITSDNEVFYKLEK